MTEQRIRILESAGYVKSLIPKGFKVSTAIISEKQFKLPSEFRVIFEIDYDLIPPSFEDNNIPSPGKIQFVKIQGKDVIIMKGRFHFYDGIAMRDLGHIIYVLKYIGVKKIVSLEEVGYLNPRFCCGDITLIYDHINLTGDNPLIGVNDGELGLRFPDMSNAYDAELFGKISKIFTDKKVKINESVYLGIIGPESETEAEVRFYREIGSDVLGYSLVPENITAVHANLKFAAIGLITRELVADKMMMDDMSESDKRKFQSANLKKCEKEIAKVLPAIINLI